MPKYLCLQRNIPGRSGGMDTEEMRDMYARFETWTRKYAENLSDMGGKLGIGKVETAEGVSPASLSRIHEQTGGYMILSTGSMDEAATIARECPGLVGSGSACELIEIHAPSQ